MNVGTSNTRLRSAVVTPNWLAMMPPKQPHSSPSAFALYYRYGLGNAEGLECGCFGGIIASQLGVTTALRNLVLLVPTFIVFLGCGRTFYKPITAGPIEQAV